MTISLITNVAFYKNKFIIGKDNDLLIHLKQDLAYFKKITTNKINENPNIVLMGRKTWFSIPLKNRPLKGRVNFVLTNDDSLIVYKNCDFNKLSDIKETVYFMNMKMFIKIYKKFELNVFIIGGSDIYNSFLDNQVNFILRPKYLYITELKDYFKYHQYDENANYTFIKTIPDYYKLISVSEKDTCISNPKISFRFLKYMDSNHHSDNISDEKQFLNTLKHIINNGNKRIDRTNVGTVSIFGTQMRFDISQSIPLLTTKFIPLRVIIEELLWFLRGDTDAKILQEKNVKIWDGNTSREFLDNRGLQHYEHGILGPGYGFQIRFFGAQYSQMFADTSKIDTDKIGGFDQLKYILNTLNTDPFSRRIMMSYWNPPDFDKTALIPCFLDGTLVLTKNGYKNITDVQLNDLLYTHKSNWKPIKNKQMKKYNGIIYNFTLKNNNNIIRCTKEHPFYIKYKSNNTKYINDNPYWCEAQYISNEHKMCLPINKRISIRKPEVNHKDIWFLLGYFYNNGTYNKHLNLLHIKIYGSAENQCALRSKLLNALQTHLKQINSECTLFDYIYESTFEIPEKLIPYFDYISTERDIAEWVHDGASDYIYEFLNGFFYSYYYKKQLTNKNDLQINKENSIILYNIQRLYVKVVTNPNTSHLKFDNHLSELNDIVDFDDKYIYYDIETIHTENVKNINVYNFEVIDDNSYTVNNIIAHNCHTNVQFYVEKDNIGQLHLSCQFYMRSNDFALANNFNVISYTILTYILAIKCNMKPKEIIFTCGDTHVYKNHIEPIKEQLKRECRPSPVLLVNDSIKHKDFKDITIDDFELCGYFPHPTIKLDMAV